VGYDVGFHENEALAYQHLNKNHIHVHRSMSGRGAESGGMRVVFQNQDLVNSQTVVYLESLPWYLKPYLHTLSVSSTSTSSDDKIIQNLYYLPALDRERGSHIEIVASIPPNSTVTMSYDFEKAILRYTEYPPDANRGFDISPAIITLLDSQGRPTGQIRSTSALLSLPTPDFSMPYNVIILTSTVIALTFGGIYNLLTRRFVPVDEVELNTLPKWKVIYQKFFKATIPPPDKSNASS